MKSMQMGVIGALFLSVASSVSIVICNKALMTNLGFPFGILPFINMDQLNHSINVTTYVVNIIFILICFCNMVFFQQRH